MSTFPFYLVHTDVWGPSNVPNISGTRWFVTFIDDCTRVTWVYLLKQKSEVSSVFLQYFSMVKNQFGVSIKRIRSDNAKDYFNHGLNSFCQKEGIIHESSCVKTPQQNGVAGRKNGHLLDQTRAMLFQNKVPKKYWGEAVLTATYLINRLPSSVLASQTPMEVLSSFYPDVSTSCNLIPRIFGCKSFVHIHSDGRGKLDPRALKCVFIGYSSTQKGYKCYHPPSHKFLSLEMSPFMNKKVTSLKLIFRGRAQIRKMSLLYFPTLISDQKLRLKLVLKMLKLKLTMSRLKLILKKMEMLALMLDMVRI
jgi:transposase InsO family protein